MRHSLTLSIILLMLSGCAANRMGVSPSQNTNLLAISPSNTAASEGGAMQRSLDSWLKEEWTPMTTPQSVTAKKGEDGTVVTKTEPITQESEDNTPFTLQKYADKWKEYNARKAAMKEGQPQEPSHIDKVNNLPIIGK